MTKRAVVSYIFGDDWRQVADTTWPAMSSYAKQHGVEFFGVVEKRSHLRRPASWMKLAIIADSLASHDEVLWIDPDVIIVDPSVSLFDECQKHGLHHGMCLLSDANGTQHYNAGVWMCRRGVLKALVMAAMEDDLIYHDWWEQAAVARHFDEFPPFTIDESWNHWAGGSPDVRPRFRHACQEKTPQAKVAAIREWMK
jgi:hypothetical protein